MSRAGSPITTVLPPPYGSSMIAALAVMPRDSRSASQSASASLAYGHIRQPPNAGPRTVECRAMTARSPQLGSRTYCTTSCPSASG